MTASRAEASGAFPLPFSKKNYDKDVKTKISIRFGKFEIKCTLYSIAVLTLQ